MDKIKQYLKMTEKSSFSTSVIKSNAPLSPQNALKSTSNEYLYIYIRNENINPNPTRHSLKNSKGSISATNLVSVRSPFSNFQINGNSQIEFSKKPNTRILK